MMKQAQNKTNASQTPSSSAPGVNDWFKTCLKNIDALTQASRMSAEVFQGVARLQSEYMKQMMSDLSQISQDLMKPGDLKDKLQKHAHKAREGKDKTADHAKVIAQKIQDNAKNVSQVMQQRIQEARHEHHQHFDHVRQHAKHHDAVKRWSKWLNTSTSTKN